MTPSVATAWSAPRAWSRGSLGALRRLWDRAGTEVVLIGIILTLAVGDLTTDTTATRPGNWVTEYLTPAQVLAALLLPSPLWWRRAHPRLAWLAAVGTAAVFWQVLPRELRPAPASPWLVLLCAAFALGAYGRPRDGWLVALVAAAAVPVGMVWFTPMLPLGVAVITGGGYLGGAAVGRQRRLETARFEQLELAAQSQTELALATERLRIARELHDAVGHHLALATVQAAASRRGLNGGTSLPELERVIAEIEQTNRRSLADLRGIVRALREPTVDGQPELGVAAVPGLVGELQRAGLPVQLQRQGRPLPLTPQAGTAAFRAVQEGLSNCLRHAPGCAITIELNWLPRAGTLEVSVVNDAPRSGAVVTSLGDRYEPGVGLVGLRERLAECGGTLTAGPLPGGGYRLTVRVPAVVGAEVP